MLVQPFGITIFIDEILEKVLISCPSSLPGMDRDSCGLKFTREKIKNAAFCLGFQDDSEEDYYCVLAHTEVHACYPTDSYIVVAAYVGGGAAYKGYRAVI